MTSRVQRGTTPIFSVPSTILAEETERLSYTIPTQPLLHMVQHVADWVAPCPRSLHSPPPLHTPPSLPSRAR